VTTQGQSRRHGEWSVVRDWSLPHVPAGHCRSTPRPEVVWLGWRSSTSRESSSWATAGAATGHREAVGDQMEVYFDLGIRSGLDVFRRWRWAPGAVFVGRPIHWGFACAGEHGVLRALEILGGELDRVLGVQRPHEVTEIRRHHVVAAG